jgi:NADH pyrophosphatase NudC (nudix superfamily)
MADHKGAQPNFFSTYFIDRVSDKRPDNEWLAAKLRDEATRFIPVWNLKNLLTDEKVPRPVYLPPRDVQDLLPRLESVILLGVTCDRT